MHSYLGKGKEKNRKKKKDTTGCLLCLVGICICITLH